MADLGKFFKLNINKYRCRVKNAFGVQLRLHWSILLALAIFSGLKFEPVYCLSFFALILIHEIGHALAVKLFSFENHELIIHGFGGACVWSGNAAEKHNSIIAWGGILAQLIFFIIFILMSEFVNIPKYDFLEQIFRAFIGTNLFIMIINLIPVHPLDGAEAWKIIKSIWKDLRSLKHKQKYKNSDKIVQKQIMQIFKDNEGTPNSSQRTRSPRR